MKIGKAKRWNDTTKAWEFYYPATIAPALKDPNFKKADGTTVMTQGEINQQFKDATTDVIHSSTIETIEYDGSVDGQPVAKLREKVDEVHQEVVSLSAKVSYYSTISEI